MSEQIVKKAKALCEKFINKVETGKARSRETYAECKALLKAINENEPAVEADARRRCECDGFSLESDYCKYCGGYIGPA